MIRTYENSILSLCIYTCIWPDNNKSVIDWVKFETIKKQNYFLLKARKNFSSKLALSKISQPGHLDLSRLRYLYTLIYSNNVHLY